MDVLLTNDFQPSATVADAVLHVLSGSFRSLSLVLLAFSPLNRTLAHVRTVPAFGPHQYLALSPNKDYVYTTSWASPPILSSWALKRANSSFSRIVDVEHVNTVPITATSSYITIPPPYTHIYSTGGPTGEVHALNAETGGFGAKLQQLLFVPEDELERSDKSRVALRYGSHGIEFSPSGHAFIPVLGSNTIEMYRRDPRTGQLIHISSSTSPRGPDSHDGPRHVKIHPNGRVLYCVTEHTNYVDVYDILPDSLLHISSHSIIPDNLPASTQPVASNDPHLRSEFRGGTLILTPPSPSQPAPTALLTTTRGATSAQRGWLSIFRLDAAGYIVASSRVDADADADQPQQNLNVSPDTPPSSSGVIRFETPTSSGKANALDVRRKSDSDSAADGAGVWILLTDDDQAAGERAPAVRVLEWDGWEGERGVRIVAEWPTGSDPSREAGGGNGESYGDGFLGASHAVWLD